MSDDLDGFYIMHGYQYSIDMHKKPMFVACRRCLEIYLWQRAEVSNLPHSPHTSWRRWQQLWTTFQWF